MKPPIFNCLENPLLLDVVEIYNQNRRMKVVGQVREEFEAATVPLDGPSWGARPTFLIQGPDLDAPV